MWKPRHTCFGCTVYKECWVLAGFSDIGMPDCDCMCLYTFTMPCPCPSRIPFLPTFQCVLSTRLRPAGGGFSSLLRHFTSKMVIAGAAFYRDAAHLSQNTPQPHQHLITISILAIKCLSTPHLRSAAQPLHSLPKSVRLWGVYSNHEGWRLVGRTLTFTLRTV